MSSNLQLLRILYSSASAKYLKLRTRLDKATRSGRFYQLSRRKQSAILNRIKALYTRLQSLQTQLRLAGAGVAFALTLSVSNPVKAQNSLGPFERNDPENPLPPPIVVRGPHPAVVDIDNDGDLDLFVGNRYGEIEFFRNDSAPHEVRRFTDVRGAGNPFFGINRGYDAALSFIDADNDGDFDALIGNQEGFTFYYKNTGSKTNPAFTEQTGSLNPFDGVEGTAAGFGDYNAGAIPTFADFDSDGDQDLVVGSSYTNADGTEMGGINFFRNNGGTFTPIDDNTLSEALFYNEDITTTFADIDGDGDLDAFVGAEGYGPVRLYVQLDEGVFEPNEGPWNPLTKEGNPFADFSFNKYSAPVAADFDGDGDLDFIVGTQRASCFACIENTNLRYFENTDGNFTLEEITELHSSPSAGVDVRNFANPSFTDIDGDGDLDAILGSKYTNPDIHIYINNEGKFFHQTDHPLIEIIDDIDVTSVHEDVVPIFVDIDNDQDQDLFVSFDRSVRFLRNNGGTYEDAVDPFNLTPFSFWGLSIAFVDVDSDGDLDAFLAKYDYDEGLGLYYYENTSSGTSITFTEATAPAPFNVPGYFDYLPEITNVDIDHDGDQDIVGSEFYYGDDGYSYGRRIVLFANNGDGTFSKTEDPLANSQEYFLGRTTFLDMDGDGDLDSFTGESDGTIIYFENTNPPPITNIASSALIVTGGEPTILDPTLTIVDSDNDDIVNAQIIISDYVEGDEELSFDEGIAQSNGITGSFDSESGQLTFSGRATSAIYQSLLRTVSINFTGTVPAGRKSVSGKTKGELDLAQQITFQVRDTDFTLTTVSVVSLNVTIVSATSEIIIFNAISPADDSRNQFFEIRNIETVSPENKVTIFNRWGDAVFEVMNYDNTLDDKRFNGTGDNGKELPSGTYFYKIETGTKTHTGYLSLKR